MPYVLLGDGLRDRYISKNGDVIGIIGCDPNRVMMTDHPGSCRRAFAAATGVHESGFEVQAWTGATLRNIADRLWSIYKGEMALYGMVNADVLLGQLVVWKRVDRADIGIEEVPAAIKHRRIPLHPVFSKPLPLPG